MKRFLFTILICLGTLSVDAKTDYKVQLQKDFSVTITTKDGVQQVYKPDFMVMMSPQNPQKRFRRGDFGKINYSVPTWGKLDDDFKVDPKMHLPDGFNPETDRAYGKGRTADYFMSAPHMTLSATGATQEKGTIRWTFPEEENFTLSASLKLSKIGNGMPWIEIKFIPKQAAWYSIGYVGAPSCNPEETDEIWQGQIWQEKRFPHRSFISEAFRATIPATMVTKQGVTTSVIANPKYIPFTVDVPFSRNAQFGVLLRNKEGQAQPMVFAPVMGGYQSKMDANKPFTFDFYLYQAKSSLLDSFEFLAKEVCEFRDLRKNTTCNLNTTITNISDFVQHSPILFDEELKGFNYSTDVPGSVKNISASHLMETAILSDNEEVFLKRARPIFEYGLSREGFLFSTNEKVKSQGASHKLNGPGVPVTDLLISYIYSGQKTEYFLHEAQRRYFTNDVRILNEEADYADIWLNSLALYRATGEERYLKRAIKDCDDYLAYRLPKQVDFSDKSYHHWVYWISYCNQWVELYQMYKLTGYKRYLDAAHEGARYYTQYCWMTPVIPNAEIKVNLHNKVPTYRIRGSKTPIEMSEEMVEAWKVSEIGLAPESTNTSHWHRGVFMSHHAPFMMRLAAETGDDFLRAIARHAVVGRYEGFPGYHINDGRTTAFAKKDWAWRPQKDLNKHTSIHYNHPASHLTMLWDYLFSDFFYLSQRQIDFPSEYSKGYAYCRSMVYGMKAGTFYGEKNVYPYMPDGLMTVSNPQANYLAGYGNGKFYVALSNQSDEDIEVSLEFDAQKSGIAHDQKYKVALWKENQPRGKAKIERGRITVSLKAKGITALIIEGVSVKTKFQHKYFTSTPMWAKTYTSTNFLNDRAVFFNFGEGLSSVYLWHEADNKKVAKTTLHYAIDGKWQVTSKKGYPYEFTIEIPDSAQQFDYWWEVTNTNGEMLKSSQGTLFK